MGPVFPSALGITTDVFRRLTGTCIGLVVTAGWIGAAVSSWIIGSITGQDPNRLAAGMMTIPLFSALMAVLSLAASRTMPKEAACY